MSWVRFGSCGSEVYVFETVEDLFECCGCCMAGTFFTPVEELMVNHLRAHDARGDSVPPCLLGRDCSDYGPCDNRLINQITQALHRHRYDEFMRKRLGLA